MNFESYVTNPPALHTWDEGKTWDAGGFSTLELRKLHDIASGFSSASIIETGCGNSSIAFLLSGAKRVVSIDIERDVTARVTEYCDNNGIDRSSHSVIIEPSEWALPKLAASGEKFDVSLIDGCHGWPAVFVDFCYINAMLRKEGILVVDDIQLYSVSELANWLSEQYEFQAVDIEMPKTKVFKKIADETLFNGWGHQPYIAKMSDYRALLYWQKRCAQSSSGFMRRIANKLGQLGGRC